MIAALLFFDTSGRLVFEQTWQAVHQSTKAAYIAHLMAGGVEGIPFVNIQGCSFLHLIVGTLVVAIACTCNMNACLMSEVLRQILMRAKLLLLGDEEGVLCREDVERGCVELSELLEVDGLKKRQSKTIQIGPY